MGHNYDLYKITRGGSNEEFIVELDQETCQEQCGFVQATRTRNNFIIKMLPVHINTY